jgi:cytochrome c oxidase cbb3-type subunit 3
MMLNSFWNWFAIIVIIASILACWWLLHWTKGISNRKDDEVGDTGHVWDHDVRELNNPLPRWWLHLFNITIVFSLIYLVLFPGLGNFPGFLGWTQEQRYQEELAAANTAEQEVYARYADMSPDELMGDAQAMGTGRRLFGQNCAMCHGSDARGAYGFPNLADSEWQWGGGHETVLATITNGRQAAMPAWAPMLGEDGVNEVTEYVMSLSGQISGHKEDSDLATAGQEKFMMFCVACHGPEGKGNPALGAPDLTNDVWLYRGDREAIMEELEAGRNGNMPAFGDQLSEERRRILAAYVLSLNEGAPSE